jgi:hypothetical protein
MKKAILTVGLFSMMMILTSFTNSEAVISSILPTPIEIGGNQGAPRDRSIGFEIGGNQGAPRDRSIGFEIGGNQGAPRDRSIGFEIGGNQGAPRDRSIG